jgi:hypothetical protein
MQRLEGLDIAGTLAQKSQGLILTLFFEIL